jgi:hypothetical protein
MCLFTGINDFVSSVFDLNKRFFGLLKKLTPCLDVFDQPSGKQTDADRINFALLEL